MRIAYFIISFVTTIALIILLDRPLGPVPPIGSFVSPQHGFWQNAEAVDRDFSGTIILPALQDEVDIYFDERMVPHVFANKENDAWFAQGYLHAKFRLWQMEFQTHAAAGRLTEILGPGPDSAYLNNDRNMRRVGMIYGAKRTLEEMMKDSITAGQLNAYTAGVNSYIEQLTVAELPLEYRLLNYRPEKWTNLKTALFLKYMSYDLTGAETDIEHTNARSFFSKEDFEKLYPVINESSSPVVPAGTYFPPASIKPIVPVGADSLYFDFAFPVISEKPDRDNGSNNWAVSGSKTTSGRPILCNDPHLGLNLPSLWFEMQIHTPGFNVYGVSFPGAPAIIIGFNENIAWGVTNAARDVRDYYRITFKDRTQTSYWFNGQWQPTERVVEDYVMKDGSVFSDTVAYTIFGPVIYDDSFSGNGRVAPQQFAVQSTDTHQQPGSGRWGLAVRWKAHDSSNELKTFLLLNRAKDYNDYEHAISHFSCPGQNFAFASRSGDIALWQQGAFPAKWQGQGDFVMPGTDSSFMWQGDIPQPENPHYINPPRGFVSSANQVPADTVYPYYLGGHYDLYRGLQINRLLENMSGITTADMQQLQNNNDNAFAEDALPFLMANIVESHLSENAKKYLDILSSWNRKNEKDEKGPTIFVNWIEQLQGAVWDDELSGTGPTFERPDDFTTITLLKREPELRFIDDITTPGQESLSEIVTKAFQRAVAHLEQAEKEDRLSWSSFKDAGIRHLLRLEPLSRFHLTTGGGTHIINATKQFHGPSWKMIVEMTDEPQAYGIYPGGQSGNPGSRFYDPFVDDWAAGKYYRLWLMKKEEVNSDRVKHVLRLAGDQN